MQRAVVEIMSSALSACRLHCTARMNKDLDSSIRIDFRACFPPRWHCLDSLPCRLSLSEAVCQEWWWIARSIIRLVMMLCQGRSGVQSWSVASTGMQIYPLVSLSFHRSKDTAMIQELEEDVTGSQGKIRWHKIWRQDRAQNCSGCIWSVQIFATADLPSSQTKKMTWHMSIITSPCCTSSSSAFPSGVVVSSHASPSCGDDWWDENDRPSRIICQCFAERSSCPSQDAPMNACLSPNNFVRSPSTSDALEIVTFLHLRYLNCRGTKVECGMNAASARWALHRRTCTTGCSRLAPSDAAKRLPPQSQLKCSKQIVIVVFSALGWRYPHVP